MKSIDFGACFSFNCHNLHGTAVLSFGDQPEILSGSHSTDQVGGIVELGYFVACQYTSNPGPVRLPEVVASQFADDSPAILTTGVRAIVTANNRRGEATDYCATASGAYHASGGGTTLTVSGSTTAFTTLPALVKIKDRLAIATAVTVNSITLA